MRPLRWLAYRGGQSALDRGPLPISWSDFVQARSALETPFPDFRCCREAVSEMTIEDIPTTRGEQEQNQHRGDQAILFALDHSRAPPLEFSKQPALRRVPGLALRRVRRKPAAEATWVLKAPRRYWTVLRALYGYRIASSASRSRPEC